MGKDCHRIKVRSCLLIVQEMITPRLWTKLGNEYIQLLYLSHTVLYQVKLGLPARGMLFIIFNYSRLQHLSKRKPTPVIKTNILNRSCKLQSSSSFFKVFKNFLLQRKLKTIFIFVFDREFPSSNLTVNYCEQSFCTQINKITP